MSIQPAQIKSYVIVGGGTAGWITAAILGRVIEKTGAKITVVESPEISTIGVGEATVPSFVDMLKFLGISEKDFIESNNATFKLGIKFTNWQKPGDSYWHPFGMVGTKINGLDFFQIWLKARFEGHENQYTDYSPSALMGQEGKFYIPDPEHQTNLSTLGYALHFDASRAADYLAKYAHTKGVERVKAHVEQVFQHENGSIKSLLLKNGDLVEGDFFFDCTGQGALLIGNALNINYVDWSSYLPVDRAAVVQSKNVGTLPPYTEAFAHEHGWRWKIPLQNRTGNGYVYCSKYCTEQDAIDLLVKNVSGEILMEPRTIHFTTGKRAKMWEKNCVAIGLSSGFLEPLESTSIYLIMRAALNFIGMLPNADLAQATQDEYNRLMNLEYECLRDFIVAHYCTSQRADSIFWMDWQARDIPSSLKIKLELYKSQGRLVRNDMDLFASNSWYAVLSGMGILPNSCDPIVAALNGENIHDFLGKAKFSLAHSVSQLLEHDEYLRRLLKK